MWYLSFCVWFASLSMIISRPISVAANGIISFFFPLHYSSIFWTISHSDFFSDLMQITFSCNLHAVSLEILLTLTSLVAITHLWPPHSNHHHPHLDTSISSPTAFTSRSFKDLNLLNCNSFSVWSLVSH